MRNRGSLNRPSLSRPRPGCCRAVHALQHRISTVINGLRRSQNDRWLGGVCGGLARFTGVDSWLWRLGFVLLVIWLVPVAAVCAAADSGPDGVMVLASVRFG